MSAPITITNARIWTAAQPQPTATSIRMANGRITALDSPEQPGDILINAQGRFIIPGMIDSHVHLLVGGESLHRLDLSDISTRADFEAGIARTHGVLPPGDWLIASGWSDANLAADGLPDHTWLAAAGDRPTVAYRSDLHAALVNQPILEMLDLNDVPPGGHVVRDVKTGRPTGLLVEAVAWHMLNPMIPRADAKAKQQALLAAVDHCHRMGLTMVGTMEYQRDVQSVFEPLREALSLRCMVTLLDRQWPLDTSFGQTFAHDDRLAVIGYKAFVDGTVGSRTARMFEDYTDDPGNRGMLVELARDGHLHAWARQVADAGLSPSIHAIGDEAVHLALDAVHDLSAAAPPARIEHAQQVARDDITRFAGRIASMQPLHKADDGRIAVKRLGAERLCGCYPFRALLDAGALLAFGSDWPVVSCDPLRGMHTAITGLTSEGAAFLPEENLTAEQTLRAYTIDAACALGQDQLGHLAPGCLADLVMLDRDPLTCNWAQHTPRVAMTVACGEIVWQGD